MIGSILVHHWAERWRITASDLRASDGIGVLDVTDLAACRAAFVGADAVVHLAADSRPGADWSALRGPNLDGAHAVAQAARDCAVRRLVLASSLHAVGGAELEERVVLEADPPIPVNLYGATKAWLEALGSWIATTSPTSVVTLRIGWVMPGPLGEDARTRDRGSWLSYGDCAELFRCAVEAEIDGMIIVNGVSANRHPTAELGEAARRIGYAPSDDAWAAL